jgi:hypothetical protein
VNINQIASLSALKKQTYYYDAQRGDAFKQGGGRHRQRQASKLASVDVCPGEQRISPVNGEAMVVLFEVLNSSQTSKQT